MSAQFAPFDNVQLGKLCVIGTGVSSVATRVVDPLAENGLYLSGRLTDTAKRHLRDFRAAEGVEPNCTCPRKRLKCGT